MLEIIEGICIEFDYINWKGVFGHRKGRVQRFYFGSTEFHSEEQWLIEMLDLDKHELRIFAMKDMSNILLIKEAKQWSGFTDMTGKKIFEFDIMEDKQGYLGKVFKVYDGFIVTTNYKGASIEDKYNYDYLTNVLIKDNDMKIIRVN